MQQSSISAASEEAILALIDSKGAAYVQRQYDSGLLSAVIDPAFERWQRTQAQRPPRMRIPMSILVVGAMVGYFVLVWSV